MQGTLWKDKCNGLFRRLDGLVRDLLVALIERLRPLWLIGLWLIALTAFLGITNYIETIPRGRRLKDEGTEREA